MTTIVIGFSQSTFRLIQCFLIVAPTAIPITLALSENDPEKMERCLNEVQ